MSYLLDTNAAIAVLRNRPAAVRERLRRAAAGGASIAISAVALFELWYGVARSERRHQNAERLRVFLAGAITIIAFEDDDAATAGDLRAHWKWRAPPIGPYDLLIAAQELRLKSTLVTANVAEFARVPGLVWQDWTAKA